MIRDGRTTVSDRGGVDRAADGGQAAAFRCEAFCRSGQILAGATSIPAMPNLRRQSSSAGSSCRSRTMWEAASFSMTYPLPQKKQQTDPAACIQYDSKPEAVPGKAEKPEFQAFPEFCRHQPKYITICRKSQSALDAENDFGAISGGGNGSETVAADREFARLEHL